MASEPGRLPAARRLVAGLGIVAFVSACGPDAPAKVCPEPQPGGDAAVLPAGIDLQRYGTLTESKSDGEFISAVVISQRSIDQLYDPLLEDVQEADYSVLNSENEHFEAEIFFGDSEGRVALMNLREGPCRGQVTIRLTFG